MKKISYTVRFAKVVVIFSLLFFFPQDGHSADINLFLNPGLETSTNNLPVNWSKTYWGTPAPTFTYPDVGRTTGSKAATITFTKNSNGDARWSPDAVQVTSGTTYTYNNWYKSTAATEINAEYTDGAGKVTYAFILSLPSSAGVWKLASTTIKVPAGVVKARIYHLTSKKGYLTVDDFSLVAPTSGTTTPPTPPSLVFSISTTSVVFGGSATLSWNATNTTSCVASLGWSGSKSLSGSETVIPATSTTYSLSCVGVGGTIKKDVSVTVIQSVVQPPISTTTPVWNEGVVALSFDDSWISQYTEVVPRLEAAGIKGTFYITTEPVIGGWDDFMTPNQIKSIAQNGHEIAGHTVTHAHLTQLSQADLIKELQNSKSYLETLVGKKVDSFAYPYGEWNSVVKNQVIQAGYKTARGVEYEFLNSSTTDKYNLQSPCLLKNFDINVIKNNINTAKSQKKLYILCMHEVKENGDEYSITPSQLAEIINQIKISGIKTMTVTEATNKLFGI